MRSAKIRAIMCGRYTVAVSAKELWEELGLEGEPPSDLEPRYNVAPSQEVPAVVDRDPTKLTNLRWGLVPFWAKDPSIGHKMINARAEGIEKKPAFRHAFEKRRCLIPASGFYEWERRGGTGKKGVKQPHYITLESGRPLTFAGVWEVWRDADGKRIASCAIVTTDAKGEIGKIHDRMPVILPPDAREVWLDREASQEDLIALLRPFPASKLAHHPVSKVVNSPANDVPECIEPVEE